MTPPVRRALMGALFAAATAVSAPAQTTHVVQQILFTYVPQDIVIEVGDTVEWQWTSETHTVTEGSGPIPTGDEAFDGVLNVPNPIFSVTFDEAFLATFPRDGNVYDYYCIPHLAQDQVGSVTVNSPWSNLGDPLAGTNGDPLLYGTGSLEAGSLATLVLENALPNATVGFFLSFASTPTPFKGGTLCTIPIFSLTIFPIGPSGAVTLPSVIPAGIPSGTEAFWQFAIQDPGAPNGVALSNCLQSIFP